MLPSLSRRLAPISCLCVFASISIASGASAQESALTDEDSDRPQEPYQNQQRRSRLVGADDDLAIESANGELIYFRDVPGCTTPVSRGGLIKVDCTMEDGPAYYFDESTREMVEACSVWVYDPEHCPPKQWPVEIPSCNGRIPESITGTWQLYATPGSSGFSRVSDGESITLTDERIFFDFPGSRPLARAYSIVERIDHRFSVEIRDDRNATTMIQIELAPCGVFVESEAVCDEFCQNFSEDEGVPTDEEIREGVIRISSSKDEASIARVEAAIRESTEEGPVPIFEQRAFFIGSSLIERP